jgi:hypothetical protein
MISHTSSTAPVIARLCGKQESDRQMHDTRSISVSATANNDDVGILSLADVEPSELQRTAKPNGSMFARTWGTHASTCRVRNLVEWVHNTRRRKEL